MHTLLLFPPYFFSNFNFADLFPYPKSREFARIFTPYESNGTHTSNVNQQKILNVNDMFKIPIMSIKECWSLKNNVRKPCCHSINAYSSMRGIKISFLLEIKNKTKQQQQQQQNNGEYVKIVQCLRKKKVQWRNDDCSVFRLTVTRFQW